MNLSDRINPVALKELRQWVRNRAIGGVLRLFFAVLLILTLIVVTANSEHGFVTDPNTGKYVFQTLSVPLGLVLLLLLPRLSFARLLMEHGDGKTDLGLATTLSPARYLDGKLFAGAALEVLFIAAALPFILLAYLLRGLDPFEALLFVVFLFFLGLVCLAGALCLGALRTPVAIRKTLFMLCLLQTVFVPFSLPFIWGETEIPGVWVHFIVDAGLLAVAAILRGIAITQLAPAGTNRSRPLRWTVSIVWALGLAGLGIAEAISAEPMLAPGSIGLLFPICAYAFFEASGAPGYSRRVLLDRPRNRFRRFFAFFGATGAESGLAHAAILAIGTGLAGWLGYVFGTDFKAANEPLKIFAILLYATATVLLLRAVWRHFLPRRVPHGIIGLVAAFLPLLVSMLQELLIKNPPDTAFLNVFRLLDSVSHDDVFVHFLMALAYFAVALIAFAPQFFRAVRTYAAPPDAR